MQKVQDYLKMIIITFKGATFTKYPMLWAHQTYRYPIRPRKKVAKGPNVLKTFAYSLSTFLFFDKDILGNEAATE